MVISNVSKHFLYILLLFLRLYKHQSYKKALLLKSTIICPYMTYFQQRSCSIITNICLTFRGKRDFLGLLLRHFFLLIPLIYEQSIYSINKSVCQSSQKRQNCKNIETFSFFQFSVVHTFSYDFKQLRYLWMLSILFSEIFFYAYSSQICESIL